VLIGGVLVGTLLTLLFLPALCALGLGVGRTRSVDAVPLATGRKLSADIPAL